MKSFNKKVLIVSCFAAVCTLCSCKNENHAPVQLNAIIGQWNLQQQHVTLLIDGVNTIDTVYTANAVTNTYAYVVFNSDGTDSTRSVYNPANLNLAGPVPYFASSKGVYSITNNTFNSGFGVSGWFSFAVGSTGTPPAVSIVYKITSLTPSVLNLQEELSFTVTNIGTHTYQETSYYYYTR